MEIRTTILSKSDLSKFKQLIRLFADVFETDTNMPSDEHLLNLLKQPGFMVLVAQSGSNIVGGLTAYTIHQYVSEKPLAYVYDLAVSRKYQRRGIGRELMADIRTYCAEKGYEEVFVQADKVDTHALEFYRNTVPTEEEDVSHFYYLLNSAR